jgi:hypothetical protein
MLFGSNHVPGCMRACREELIVSLVLDESDDQPRDPAEKHEDRK